MGVRANVPTVIFDMAICLPSDEPFGEDYRGLGIKKSHQRELLSEVIRWRCGLVGLTPWQQSQLLTDNMSRDEDTASL